MKILLSLLCVGIFLSPLSAQDDSATFSKIVAMEKAWNQAFKFRDTKAIDVLLDDGVVLVNDEMRTPISAFRARWRRRERGPLEMHDRWCDLDPLTMLELCAGLAAISAN